MFIDVWGDLTWFSWTLIVAAILGLALGCFQYYNNYMFRHPCIKSHVETQWEMPASVVIDGYKGSGGVTVPMGNAKQVQVTVCDERK